MKLNRYKIIINSCNTYVREVVAKNKDEAIDAFFDTLSDDDKVAEDDYDVADVEDLGDESKVYHD